MYSSYFMLLAVRCFTFSRLSFGVDINKALHKFFCILSGNFTFLLSWHNLILLNCCVVINYSSNNLLFCPLFSGLRFLKSCFLGSVCTKTFSYRFSETRKFFLRFHPGFSPSICTKTIKTMTVFTENDNF